MRKLFLAASILKVSVVVKKKWRTSSPEDFRDWLISQRTANLRMSEIEMAFFAPWIARLSHRIFSDNSCVIAASIAFVFAPMPVTLHFGVNQTGQFLSHAWAEWPTGHMQLDSKSTYEKVWEFTS